MDFPERVAKLRERGGQFAALMAQLEALRPALRPHPAAAADLEKFLAEGASIRGAIQSATKTIDGATRWINRTFQTDAIENVPFAAEIVSTTAAGAVSAIEYFQDRANAFLAAAKPIADRYAALPDEEKAALAGTEVAAVAPKIGPAMILLAVLGGAFAWFHFSGRD